MVTEEDQTLLSAFLDGELGAVERRKLELRLDGAGQRELLDAVDRGGAYDRPAASGRSSRFYVPGPIPRMFWPGSSTCRRW